MLVFFTLGFQASKTPESIRVRFNEEFLPSSAGVMVRGDEVFMSYRLVGKYFGALTQGDHYTFDQQGFCTISQEGLEIEMRGGIAEAKVNGKAVKLSAAPFIENFGEKGFDEYELMVPLGSVAEIFSSEVKWDKKSNIVSIKTPKRKVVKFDRYYVSTETTGSNGSTGTLTDFYTKKKIKDKVIFPEPDRGDSGYDVPPGYDVVHQNGRTYVSVSFGMRTSGGYSAVPQRVYLVEGKGYYIASTLYEPYGIVTTALTYPGYVIGFENKQKLPVFVGMPKAESRGQIK
ncbi:MAG: stalk domain-containing protein [Peptostreptococcaceae bacterium]|nr:stalk domain-containing protein [Peptostreptococcaceae bacterium]